MLVICLFFFFFRLSDGWIGGCCLVRHGRTSYTCVPLCLFFNVGDFVFFLAGSCFVNNAIPCEMCVVKQIWYRVG